MQANDVVQHGVKNFCPFCASLAWSKPTVGTRVLILNGIRCGDRAEIIELDPDPDVLICHFDGDPESWTYRENRRHDLILLEDLYGVPRWAPPISVEDASILHGALLYRFAEAVEQGDPIPQKAMLQALIQAAWQQRLPLTPSDVLPMLLAHGLSSEAEPVFGEFFSFGLELLVQTNGRAPIKRKRMEPFSSFKYLPARKVREASAK